VALGEHTRRTPWWLPDPHQNQLNSGESQDVFSKAAVRPEFCHGPTSCDVAQVRRIYEHVRLQAAEVKKHQPLAQIAKIVPVGPGEEPVDDDTPIVVKKP